MGKRSVCRQPWEASNLPRGLDARCRRQQPGLCPPEGKILCRGPGRWKYRGHCSSGTEPTELFSPTADRPFAATGSQMSNTDVAASNPVGVAGRHTHHRHHQTRKMLDEEDEGRETSWTSTGRKSSITNRVVDDERRRRVNEELALCLVGGTGENAHQIRSATGSRARPALGWVATLPQYSIVSQGRM